MTALAEGICLVGLAGFYVANGLRVDLSYQPWSPARDAVLARYGFWEGVFASITMWPAFFVVLPLLALQLLACASARSREIVTAGPWATRLLVVKTLVGIPGLLFLALICSLSLGVGMIG